MSGPADHPTGNSARILLIADYPIGQGEPEAGDGVLQIVDQGEAQVMELPAAFVRSLDVPDRGPMSAVPPPLDSALEAGLRRLKLATVRRLGPEVLQTAKTQRWAPAEVLRTLVEAEISARDQSNVRNRLRQAGFPVEKSLTEFNLSHRVQPLSAFGAPGHGR